MAADDLATGVIFAGLDPQLFYPAMLLIAALLVGAVVIAFVRRWQQLQQRAVGTNASDQLAQYRQMFEKGKISEEEFKRLRAVLSEELRKEIDLPPPASAQPAPAPQAIQPAPTNAPPPEANGPPDTGIRPA